ncbi:MAG TPA: DUF6249 domain-containing protein [Acidobacteriota bacterium]|nr:DUF6249 domain-containing protein [Acidobacteriota bacterium]HQQ47985.1 DUF6249 domain-containing protein [Acidobacteriota bacterium]
MEQSVDITAIFVLGSMCFCAVLIVAASLYYHYKKENIRSAERLAAIEKGIAPKDLFQNGENGNEAKGYTSKKDSEIYGGIKILIVGLFLALALWISAGGGDHQFDAAVWGLFVAGVGLAKIIVGMLMGRMAKQE